jgi:hypothetical protein
VYEKTPVIAFRRGSVPEVVENGVSGFVVESVNQAATAVRQVAGLDRASVRAAFEQRFTIERTARDYLEIYNELIHQAADGDRRRKTSHPNGTTVPGLPPTAIVTKRVRQRGKLSAKVLDVSTKAVVGPFDIARFTIPHAASDASRNDVIKRRRSNDPQDDR